MRTKKPLDLHLAQPMWKLLAGITLTTEDLEEVGIECVQTCYSDGFMIQYHVHVLFI